MPKGVLISYNLSQHFFVRSHRSHRSHSSHSPHSPHGYYCTPLQPTRGYQNINEIRRKLTRRPFRDASRHIYSAEVTERTHICYCKLLNQLIEASNSTQAGTFFVLLVRVFLFLVLLCFRRGTDILDSS